MYNKNSYSPLSLSLTLYVSISVEQLEQLEYQLE